MKAKTSSAKKKTAKKKVVTPQPKKKTALAKPKTKAAAKKPKKKKAALKKPKKKKAAPREKTVPARRAVAPEAPPTRRSEPALAVATQRPVERPLTDEEREAMSKCAQTALAALEADGAPAVIVMRIGAFVDEVRVGRRPQPTSQDVRLGLGVLWGEQVRAQVGWRWVHLSYPDGFASYALVPDDRAFACFPLNRLSELMRPGADGVDTSVALFDSIRVGTLPAGRENAYLVIG